MATTEVFQGRPGTIAFEVGGTAEDPRGAQGEVGMVGLAVDIPNTGNPVREPNPPCDVPQAHELIIGLAEIGEFAAGGGTILGAARRLFNPGPGMLAQILRSMFGAYSAQCVALGVRIPDGYTMTRIQTTVSTNGHPAAGAIFRVDPAVGHIQQYNANLQAYRMVPDVAASDCASYSGAPPEFGLYCSFGHPLFYNAAGQPVDPEHPSKVLTVVVFKNSSHEWLRTPFLRVYYR